MLRSGPRIEMHVPWVVHTRLHKSKSKATYMQPQQHNLPTGAVFGFHRISHLSRPLASLYWFRRTVLLTVSCNSPSAAQFLEGRYTCVVFITLSPTAAAKYPHYPGPSSGSQTASDQVAISSSQSSFLSCSFRRLCYRARYRNRCKKSSERKSPALTRLALSYSATLR